jgi:ppGpp synthetase/RelA/SpoT-type nucleotidyltranferase
VAQVLTYAVNYSRNEYERAKKTSTDYHVSLLDALTSKGSAADYDQLFKSAPSIVNKLWRKNRDATTAHLGNIQQNITDLVRTDISATTLDSAEFLASCMNALPGIIYGPEVKKAFDDAIGSISFGPEMKMESGYFAYHGLVHFKTGLVVEVQIYSDLMKQWRKLSHALYELARVEPIRQHEFNSKESRLISLGHLLHLAECQLQQLRQEFGGR